MIDVPRSRTGSWDGSAPSWYRWREKGHEDEVQVILTCPKGHRLTLFNRTQAAPRHGIAADGTVDGSVVCQGRPDDPCGFHYHVRLLDWTGETLARL